MPKTYHLNLTEWGYLFLKWVRDGCSDDLKELFFAEPHFIKRTRALIDERLIKHYPDKGAMTPTSELYQITNRGRAAIILYEENVD